MLIQCISSFNPHVDLMKYMQVLLPFIDEQPGALGVLLCTDTPMSAAPKVPVG